MLYACSFLPRKMDDRNPFLFTDSVMKIRLSSERCPRKSTFLLKEKCCCRYVVLILRLSSTIFHFDYHSLCLSSSFYSRFTVLSCDFHDCHLQIFTFSLLTKDLVSRVEYLPNCTLKAFFLFAGVRIIYVV